MITPLTEDQLADIAAKIGTYRKHEPTGFACCTAHLVADAGAALLAEVHRLRAQRDDLQGKFADAAASLAEQVLRYGKRQREHNADREEMERLRTELVREERLHSSTIADRDRASDAADRLAYAVASEDVIGEHTADNSPWANAAELITSAADVDKLRARVRELERPAVEVKRNEIRQSYAELISQAREDRDYEGAFDSECLLREREKQWASEDAAPAVVSAEAQR